MSSFKVSLRFVVVLWLAGAAAACGRTELAGCAGDEQCANDRLCEAGFADCNGDELDGCETNLNQDSDHCGACEHACSVAQDCRAATCELADGAFEPSQNPTFLQAGAHHFSRVHIPAGVTVYVSGSGDRSGQLELFAEGAIVVDGTIDLSGGPGTRGSSSAGNIGPGHAGAGGFTGEPYRSGADSANCGFVAGNPGMLGAQVVGSSGNCPVIGASACESSGSRQLLFTAPVAQAGGGAGVHTGYRAYGSGGGGPAGGAPGALCSAFFQTSRGDESDCSGVAGGGGAVAGNGGYAGLAPYDGNAGSTGQSPCAALWQDIAPGCVGGGGGGSIGSLALADLAVLSTFQTGSGGGGGSADFLERPSSTGTSGGGGGGGALRLASNASLTVNGKLLVNGGPGGDAFAGTGPEFGCDPEPGAAGGGGSGGVIYLSSPSIVVRHGAVISALGGRGGEASPWLTGGSGGAGGLGRIRLSLDPSACSLEGDFSPPVVAGCEATSQNAATFVGVYPN